MIQINYINKSDNRQLTGKNIFVYIYIYSIYSVVLSEIISQTVCYIYLHPDNFGAIIVYLYPDKLYLFASQR